MKKISNYKNFVAVLILALFCGGAVTYAQFARQTGDVGWGYGYGYGYGFGYGWDGGISAGHRTDTEDEWTLYSTTDSDIATNNILSIANNPNGSDVYLGDSGSEGLMHFDGSNWTQYTTSNSDIPGDAIRVFEVDQNGTVWMTDGMVGGLIGFDGSNWVRYTTDDGLPTNIIANLDIDSSGNLWIVTIMYGVIKFDGSTFTNYTTLDGVPAMTSSIAVDSSDNVWVGTMNAGTGKFDGSTWTTYDTTSNPSDIPSNAMQMVSAGPNGEVWFALGGMGAGVLKFDGSSTWTHYTDSDTSLLAPAGGAPGDIFVDSTGNMWLKMTMYEGPIKFDGSTWTQYTISNSDIPNNSTYRTREIDGNIWFTSSSGKGAIKLDPANPVNEYRYGYGYGYMIGHADDELDISWDAGGQTYEIDEANLETQLFTNAGIVIPDTSDATSAGSVTFNFAVDISAGNNAISIPSGIVMTTEDLTLQDFTEFKYSELDEENVTLPDGQDFVQAFSFGIASVGLDLSSAIDISAAVGDDYNDTTLNVYHMSPTEDEWTLITTCEVSLGDCRFETTALSSFLVTSESAEEEPSTPSGGGVVPVHLLSGFNWGAGSSVVEENGASGEMIRGFKFTKDLKRGMIDGDVRELQKFLNTHGFKLAEKGFGSPGNETFFFGPRTQQALRAYQKANGITPSAGYFGVKTRTVVNDQIK